MALLSGTYRSGLFLATLGILSAVVTGCGSGGANSSGGGGTNPPPAGDFSVSVTPTSLTLDSGGSQTVTVSVAEVNTFTASVNLSVIGLPQGVMASPSTFSLTPGNKQAITVSATVAAATGTATITFQGTSGSLSHSAQTTLRVILPPVTGAHAPIRTRYLRTDSFYDPNSLQSPVPHFTVYDAAHRQFFVSNPYLNEIDVFDAAQETQKGVISVPLAWGIDVSPTDGTLWAGTLLGDVYNISTTTLSVMTRYPASSIGPSGFTATTTLALADGRLALQGGAGGILGVDGYGSAIVWNPQTNAVDTGTSIYGAVCPYSNGGFALDGTRTLILVTTVDSGGGGVPLCSYDTVARVETDVSIPQSQSTFVNQIVPTSDGKEFFLTTNGDGVEVFDPRTLQQIGQIDPPSSVIGLPDAAGGAVMSLDGKTLYLVDSDSGAIFGYDTTTYQHNTTIAHPMVQDSQTWLVASAIDETGLIVGPMGHGVGFADASVGESNSLADEGQPLLILPNTGSISGGSSATIYGEAGVGAAFYYTLSQLYVGNSLIAGATMSSSGQVSAVMPAASGGMVVDLTELYADGTVGLGPEAYSYGPTIVEVVPNAATADGGQQGAVVGYGFGNSPSAVQVSIGGQTASVQQLYNPPLSPYPFPIEVLTFTVPPGVSGTTNVTITSASGSTTGAFTYTPKSVSYPLNASLQQGIYDPHRNLYYFTDTSKIQVLSAASGSWMAPITLPGTTSASQLIGIAESPDGSKLAVADNGGQAIYVLNPDSPGSAIRYAVPVSSNTPYPFPPLALVVLDNSSVYYLGKYTGGDSSPDLLKLDLATGQFTDFQISDYAESSNDQYERVYASPDQSRVYSNLGGYVLWIDTTTDTIHQMQAASINDGVLVDGAISADGSTLSIDGYFTDALLNPETEPAYIDWETWLPTANYGQKLNGDGSILYQPLTDGVDLIERNTGHLLYRVQVPVTLANVYDPMLLGSSPGTLGFLTSQGVTFVDLSSLSILSSASAPFPAAGTPQAMNSSTKERTGLRPVPQTLRKRPTLKTIRKMSNGQM